MFVTFEPILGVVLGADYLELGDTHLIVINLLMIRILLEW